MADKQTALQADASFKRAPVWALPTEPAAFRRWLDAAGLTLEQFLAMPAAENMPKALRDAL